MRWPSKHQYNILKIMASGEVLRLVYPNQHGGVTKILKGASVDASTFDILEKSGWIEQGEGDGWVISAKGKYLVEANE